jgi:hypothetical protein
VSNSRYSTPAAFRRALTDRLQAAARDGRWTYQQLQRQVGYDRFLERLYLVDDGRIVKGADDVPPLVRGVIPDVTHRGYRAYPLVDHIADEVAATYERYGEVRLPSTRYRDLVDLVAIISAASVTADPQRRAIRSDFARTRTHRSSEA